MHVASRVLFGGLMVLMGSGHFTQTAALAGYAASKGVPAAKAVVLLTGIMPVGGGLLILLGWHRFIGAGLVFLFLVPVAFLMHNFWTQKDPAARANDMAHFLKDMALAGGALFVACYSGPEWPMSLGH
ncbi:MAG: DoxX family membrane protein [Gemmatimonadetes bacterium]|nr:DoxX family membrane protein [Gemmatimonadota bacterium]